MHQFFTADYTGTPFQFLGTAHIIALVFVLLLNLFWTQLRGISEKQKLHIRQALAIVLILNEIGYHLWNIYYGTWNIQEHIPLHVCSVLVWLSAPMLLKRNLYIYEFAYFMGIGGALQALLTPDVGIYGFPHYRFFQTFISHGLLVSAPLYLTIVEGFRPTWRSLIRVIVGMNIYMLIVFFINQAIGSNYLFVAHKPYTPSLLDVLPEWPIYILYIEAIGIILSLLLYLPFAIYDFRKRKYV